MKAFYFDLETTGLLYWKHGIHQLSALIEVDGEIVDKVNMRIQPNPKCVIDDEALKIGGIDREALKHFTPFRDSYVILQSVLSKYVDKYDKADKMHLIGYNNSSFDNNFFRAFFVQNDDKYFNSWFWIDTIDVMVLASNHFREVRNSLPDFKLGTIAKKLRIKIDESKLHDAMYDIELTRTIFKKLTKSKTK